MRNIIWYFCVYICIIYNIIILTNNHIYIYISIRICICIYIHMECTTVYNCSYFMCRIILCVQVCSFKQYIDINTWCFIVFHSFPNSQVTFRVGEWTSLLHRSHQSPHSHAGRPSSLLCASLPKTGSDLATWTSHPHISARNFGSYSFYSPHDHFLQIPGSILLLVVWCGPMMSYVLSDFTSAMLCHVTICVCWHPWLSIPE